MPVGTMQKGYPDYVGKRFIFAVPYIGPALYVVGGETVALPRYNNYIDYINSGALAVSGNYFLRAMPGAPNLSGPAAGGFARVPWKVRLFATATNVEAAAGTVLSAEVFQLTGFGGVY